MDMKVTKWDNSIAARCVERVDRGHVPAKQHHVKVVGKPNQLGEWEDFTTKINKAIMKKHR